jgi:glycosyltransferase involved in cell wall biosynthesis
MRIAIVYDCLYPHTIGGVERWYRDLASRLATNHRVTYLTRRQWSVGEEPDRPPGVEVVVVSGGDSLYTKSGRRRVSAPLRFGWGVFRHLLRHRHRYDVVHTCGFPYFHLIGAALVELLGGPRVVVDWFEVWSPSLWRDTLGLLGGRVGVVVQRLCVRLTRRAVVFSRLGDRRLREEGCRAEITLVEGLSSQTALRGDRGPREPLVVFAGRLIPEKRATAIPAAVALARRRIPGLRAIVFGDGPDRGALLREIESMGVGGAVEWRGFAPRAEVDRAMRRGSCLIHPSVREGYGLAVIEAASFGTPAIVVAAPDNAATELIEEGQNGVIACGADSASLAEAIVRIHTAGPELIDRTRDWFVRNASRLGIEASVRILEAVYAHARAEAALVQGAGISRTKSS